MQIDLISSNTTERSAPTIVDCYADSLSQFTSIFSSSGSELVDPDSVVFLDEEDLDLTLSFLRFDGLNFALVSDHRVGESLRVKHFFVDLHHQIHQILLPVTEQVHKISASPLPFESGVKSSLHKSNGTCKHKKVR